MAAAPREMYPSRAQSLPLRQSRSAQVIVVGAGLSGLQAALDLQEAGLTCLVLEAGSYLGGPASRSFAGAINPAKHNRAWNLVQQYDVAVAEANADGEHSLGDPEGAEIPNLGEEERRSFIRVRDNLEHLCETIDVNCPSLLLPNYGTMSVHELVVSQGATPEVQRMAQAWTQVLFGLSPRDVSALFFLSHCKCAGGFRQLLSDLAGKGQSLRLQRDGMEQLRDGLASRLRPGSVCFMQDVQRIDQTPGNKCVLTTRNGEEYQCTKVIMATPATSYGDIQFTPDLAGEKQWLREAGPEGFYAETTLLYDRPWWRQTGFSGYAHGSDDLVSMTTDTSDNSAGIYSLTWAVGGEPGRNLWAQHDEERQRAVLETIRSIYGEDAPEAAHLQDFEVDEFLNTSPCLAVPAAQLRNRDQDGWGPEGNIHFAGADTSQAWLGSIEGALSSGARGAGEVVDALRPSPDAMSLSRL